MVIADRAPVAAGTVAEIVADDPVATAAETVAIAEAALMARPKSTSTN